MFWIWFCEAHCHALHTTFCVISFLLCLFFSCMRSICSSLSFLALLASSDRSRSSFSWSLVSISSRCFSYCAQRNISLIRTLSIELDWSLLTADVFLDVSFLNLLSVPISTPNILFPLRCPSWLISNRGRFCGYSIRLLETLLITNRNSSFEE